MPNCLQTKIYFFYPLFRPEASKLFEFVIRAFVFLFEQKVLALIYVFVYFCISACAEDIRAICNRCNRLSYSCVRKQIDSVTDKYLYQQNIFLSKISIAANSFDHAKPLCLLFFICLDHLQLYHWLLSHSILFCKKLSW